MERLRLAYSYRPSCKDHFGLCSAMTTARLRSRMRTLGYCSTAARRSDATSPAGPNPSTLVAPMRTQAGCSLTTSENRKLAVLMRMALTYADGSTCSALVDTNSSRFM